MRRLLGFLLAAMVAGCAAPPPALKPPPQNQAGALSAADLGPMPALGSQWRGRIGLLGRQIPLPEGSWTLIAITRSAPPGLPNLARIVLLRRAGQRLTGLLEIAGNAIGHPSAVGWPTDPVCAIGRLAGHDQRLRTASHEADQPGGRQDCQAIGSLATAHWHDPAIGLAAIATLLDQMRLTLPPRAVLIAVGEDDRAYRLIARLWLADPQPDRTVRDAARALQAAVRASLDS